MARKKVSPLVRKIYEENDIENIADVQNIMKDMFKDMISLMLEGELEETLGYSRYDRPDKKNNSRNGYNHKNIKTSLGDVQLDIPRDRNGEFEPIVVPKYSRDISDIEDKIISMYSRGMSTTDINEHLDDIYGTTFSSSQISRITDKILDEANDWKNRSLKSCYPFIFLDATYFNVRSNGKIVKKAAYMIVGIDLEGQKDIIIASVDGLPGFKDVITAISQETKVQRCIVHQIRNTLRFLNYKERIEKHLN